MEDSDTWIPDYLIGVDFGMTYTGVSYSCAPDWPPPKCIQRWPGGEHLASKVPSKVAYNRQGMVKAWGFLCDNDDHESNIVEWFKLHLDPNYEDPFADGLTMEDARRTFEDFMRCLYEYVEDFFATSTAKWEEKKIEYLFSIPTTWSNPSLSAEIERLIRAAGFGRDIIHRRTKISHTEAEAAAVYAAKTGYEPGDVILVCDAGGGTTDVNILKLTASAGGRTTFDALTWAEGRSIGSTLIDMEMEKFIQEKLNTIQTSLQQSPEELAHSMMKLEGRFERFKCAFGSASANIPNLRFPIPGLSLQKSFPEIGVSKGVLNLKIPQDFTFSESNYHGLSELICRRQKLEDVFDKQVNRMCKLIDQQMRKLQDEHPQEHIAYLVLSGGLSQSLHIQRRLKAHYQTQAGTNFPNAQGMKVLLTREPQLAVVQGIVMDRSQAISRGVVVLQHRCCRVSYGIVCRQVYDETRHRGAAVTQDPLDGKEWAEDQVDWLIKQGETISVDGKSKNFCIKIPITEEKRIWKAEIVMSTANSNQLQRDKHDDGVTRVCCIEYTFDARREKLMNSRWYMRRQQYFRVEFDVRLIVGSTYLKFQMYKDGKRISREHDDIQVAWEPPKRDSGYSEDTSRIYHPSRPSRQRLQPRRRPPRTEYVEN